MSPSKKLQVLNELKVVGCTKCESLASSRTKTVFGEGNPEAQLMIFGEGPGFSEDQQGRPFVGRSGELLNNILLAMDWDRPDVYIANIVKCRPPGNRTPTHQEALNCRPYLEMQLKIVNPKYIVCLGKTASFYLLKKSGRLEDYTMGSFRGQLYDLDGRKVVCAYHPSYVLRNGGSDEIKAEVWKDLMLIKNEMEAK